MILIICQQLAAGILFSSGLAKVGRHTAPKMMGGQRLPLRIVSDIPILSVYFAYGNKLVADLQA